MFVIVPLAFGSAGFADPGAQLQYLDQHLRVRSRTPDGELPRRFAHVRAIKASADALPHVRFLGRTGVGAG
jgi:hypothetical protein